jgi:hypothetical protein
VRTTSTSTIFNIPTHSSSGETRLPFKLGDAECGLRGVSDVVMGGPPVEGRAETFLEHLEPVSKGLQWGIAKGSSR